MAFYSKYFYTFKDSQKNSFRVDFLEDVGVEPTSFELQAGVEPFSVNYPTQSKLTYKRGSGAEINLISRTDMELISLYTVGMQQIMVEVTREGELIWAGWLDSELYSEPYNITYNYPVQFSANDGVAILKRLRFVDAGGGNFEGIISQWDIIKTIIDRIGLPFVELNVALSTEFVTGYDNTASSNVLMQTYVNASNFYDEDNEAADLDEVLKGILEPYGATLVRDEGNLLIIDINSLASSSVTFKRYSGSDYSYISTETKPNTKNIRDIGWKASNQKLDIISGINEQLISFSPYNRFAEIESDESGESKLHDLGGWNQSYGYYQQQGYNYDWSTFNNGKFRGSKEDLDSEPDYHVMWSNDNNPLNPNDESNVQVVAEFAGDMPYIIGQDNSSLKIDMSALLRTKSNPYDSDEEGSHVGDVQLYARVSIGGMYWDDGTANDWVADNTVFTWFSMGDYLSEDSKADIWINERWGGELIPLKSGLNGVLKIEILSHFNTYPWDGSGSANYDYVNVEDIWLRELKINIIKTDSEANINEDDIEYIGYLNEQYKDSGDDISLICGTNVNNSPVTLGGLLREENGKFVYINEWVRAGSVAKIEELLLNTVVSNYEFSTLQLSGVLSNSFDIFNTLNDPDFIANKKFMILGLNTNYEDNESSITIAEIIEDNLIITEV